MQPRRRDREQVLESAGALFVAGVELRHEALAGPVAPQRAILPTTPFRRQRIWPEASGAPRRQWAEPAAQPRMEWPQPKPVQPATPVPSPPEDLLALTDVEGPPRLAAYLAAMIGAELGREIATDLSPLQLGLDSLTSMRIKLRVEQALGVTVELASFFRDIPLTLLARQIWSAARGGPISPEEAATILERVALLTDAEVDALLLRMLKE